MRIKTKLLLAVAPVAALAAVLTLSAAAPALPALAGGTVGDEAPAFTLTDLDGSSHSLADYAGKTVVLEWVNPNCPFSDRHAKEATMADLADKHDEVVWLGINSTAANHRDFLEPAEHAEWADKNGVDYAILYDETGETGKAYGAKTTPHMYIIDGDGTIVYNGAIDDDPPGRKDQAERANYVDTGLVALAAGNDVDPASTKPYGCSVKY